MPACDAIWSAVATIADAPRVDPTGAADPATGLTLRPPYAGRVIVRRYASRVALSLGAVVTITGSLCPWVASGSVDRSSYEPRSRHSLGFAEGGPFGLAVRAWPLMPLMVVTGTVAMWWNRRVVGAALALAGGLYAFAVALAVRRAPSTSLLRIRVGTVVTIAGASILVAATLVALAFAAGCRKDRRPGR